MTVQFTNERMKAALADNRGMVYLAAQQIGCKPETIYARARVSDDIREAIRHQRGRVVDAAELKLFQAIERGEQWAVQMCLKTLGKDRGYVERTEHRAITDDDLDAAVEAELAGLALRGSAPPAGAAPGAKGCPDG